MKYSKNDKIEASKKLGADFKSADVFFAAFQGLKFGDLNVLRDKLRPAKSKFTVTRNTIISHAVESAGLKSDDISKGPTAVVTIGDPDELTRVAKVLADFAKTNPALKIKGGFTSDKWLTPEDCKRLSSIGSKSELISQLANVLYSNLAQIRFVLEAPTRDLAYVVEALREKKSKE